MTDRLPRSVIERGVRLESRTAASLATFSVGEGASASFGSGGGASSGACGAGAGAAAGSARFVSSLSRCTSARRARICAASSGDSRSSSRVSSGFAATRRAEESVTPPGANGTTIRSGLDGHD